MTGRQKKKRLTGAALVVTDRWKADVKAKLVARDWSFTRLAEAVGLSPSAVSRLLEGDQPTSRAAAAISQVLGIPLPSGVTEEDQHWNELGHRLRRDNPEEYEKFVEWLRLRLRV